jgi:hypothetical protein
MIRHRSPAYITEELFYEYISNVFLPYVLVVRDRPGFQNEMAVPLMDLAFPHMSECLRRQVGENNGLAITFPARPTNLFQALDPVFFRALKRLKSCHPIPFTPKVIIRSISLQKLSSDLFHFKSRPLSIRLQKLSSDPFHFKSCDPIHFTSQGAI